MQDIYVIYQKIDGIDRPNPIAYVLIETEAIEYVEHLKHLHPYRLFGYAKVPYLVYYKSTMYKKKQSNDEPQNITEDNCDCIYHKKES